MINNSAKRLGGKTLLPYLNWLGLVFIVALGFIGLHWFRNPHDLAAIRLSGLATMGIIGTWRWSWWGLQVLRSRIFLFLVFPRWRKRANKIPLEDLPPMCFLVPTYKEKPWITQRVFEAIAKEAKTLAHPITLLVTASSDEENAAVKLALESIDPDLSSIRLIQMVQTGEGKRKAMADALRELARHNLPDDTVVALMDGDSEITPGTLHKCLPFFRMFPKMAALTTDELPIVEGSYLFSEWFHLRLSQRHYQMCSVSLSRKIMCLTGRFSLFRGRCALSPSFADQLETDTLDDWLWGQFKFLSGDDKSTWFWLLKHGYDMIYVPDVIVYSIETISGSLADRAYQNMRRWYGNMLRNSDRAIALGPRKNGWFMWWCLIDQRISYWTTLLTPSLLLITLLQKQWLGIALISSWILFTRPLLLIIIFSGRKSHLKPIHLPIFIISQWAASLVKIWTQMNLAQQKWKNRGNQSISAEGTGWVRFTKVGTSRFLIVTQTIGFVIILLSLANIINPVEDIAGLWWNKQVYALSPAVQTIQAMDNGVFPSDGKDDSASLQAIINGLPTNGKIQINLPIGEIDLSKPLEINRSNTVIKGQGIGRTILQANFNSQIGEAAIKVRPTTESIIKNIRLGEFTLVDSSAQDDKKTIKGIVLEKVEQAKLNNLDFGLNGDRSVIMRQTQEVKMEYITHL
ncbi:MAG: glycosyltransferase [Rivularia sp. (in: cyanobacteria)]